MSTRTSILTRGGLGRRLPQAARLRRPLAVVAVLGVTALGTGSAGMTAAFADGSGHTAGDVAVTNTETVQIYTDANGKVDSRRVYEQLTLSGHGSVDLANPVSTDGLRNLDGFGGVTLKGGDQIVDTSVSGEKALRTVSTYTGDAPLSVAVHYTLDGKPVSAQDIVGRSGHLKVTYTVTNSSGVPAALTYGDGHGGTVTKTVDVPIPMVASLALTTPDTYRNVTSKDAEMGGDGHGGMMLSFTMTLLPPVGPATSSVSYEADITHGVVPRAELTALPVDPLTNPTFASAAKQYQGGADQGSQLADGALQLDGGLVKLHGGASQLLAGLIKLHDGAGQLRAGLQGQAAPGAQRLAAGTGQLVSGMDQLDAGGAKLRAGAVKLHGGMGQLDAGAGRLNAGAGALYTGTGAALSGAEQLSAGLSKLVDGLTLLAGTTQSPGLTAAPGILQSDLSLLQQVQDALGTATSGDCTTSADCTIIGGLAALNSRIGDAAKAAGSTDALSTSVASAQSALDGAAGSVTDLEAQLGKLGTYCAGDATCLAATSAAQADAAELGKGLTAGSGALAAAAGQVAAAQQFVGELAELSTIAGNASAKAPKTALLVGVTASLQGFVQQVQTAVVGLIGDPAHPDQPALLPGEKAALAGADQLAAGLRTIHDGQGQLLDGSNQLLDGSGLLLDGSGQLLDGSGRLAAGLGQADSGAHQLDAGAQQLASGLGAAASGSAQLDDGLGQAADGAPKIRDGLTQASHKGSRKIAAAGEQTAQQFGLMYAELKAEAARAHQHGMAYGAPAGATGLTAYDWIIQGADGHGARELHRTLMLGGVLAAGGVGLLVRRRFVA